MKRDYIMDEQWAYYFEGTPRPNNCLIVNDRRYEVTAVVTRISETGTFFHVTAFSMEEN